MPLKLKKRLLSRSFSLERQAVTIVQSPVKLHPYNITFHPDTGFYTFTTDQNIEYSCRFGNVMAMLPPLLGIYDIEVRDFMFYPYDPEPTVRKTADLRVSETIKDLLRNHFFIKPDRVIVYTCDDTDGSTRGLSRQRLFDQWYKELNDVVERHELEVEVETETGIETTYGGVIVRKDFPHPEILQTQLLDQAAGIMLEKFRR